MSDDSVAQQLHLYTIHITTWFQVTQGATTSTVAEMPIHYELWIGHTPKVVN
jgi:hypothetical protein